MKIRRKSKVRIVDEKGLLSVVRKELDGYVSREELKKILSDIQKDEERKKLWDALPTQKKVTLLRYVLKKRGEQGGKEIFPWKSQKEKK